MAELLLEFFFSSGITILRSSPMYMRQSQEAMLSTQLNAKTIRNAIRKTHQAATPTERQRNSSARCRNSDTPRHSFAAIGWTEELQLLS